MASIGAAVGIGNIWRFPYMVGAHGGDAFLLPYLLTLFGCGLPLMLLEFALGRYRHTSAVPALSTLGKPCRSVDFFLVAVLGLILSYYLVVTGWVLAYGF